MRQGAWMALLVGSAACTERMSLLASGPVDAAMPPSLDGAVAPSNDGGIEPAVDGSSIDAPQCNGAAPPRAIPVLSPNPFGADTAASCTPQALAAKVAMGGLITFRCGPLPITIALPSELAIGADTVIDGGEARLVTLQAAPRSRAFAVRGTASASRSLVLKNLTLQDGQAPVAATGDDRLGGAIFVDGGVVVVQSSTLRNNAHAVGGAIGGRGVVMVMDSVIDENVASDHGGAIALDGGELWMVRTRVVSNRAVGNGGGLLVAAQTAIATVCGSSIVSNVAGGLGGGMYFSTTMSGRATFDQTTFFGNLAGNGPGNPGQGGAMYTQGAAVTLRRSTIAGNAADYVAGAWTGSFMASGGALVAGQITMENVTVADNHNNEGSTIPGGGIWLAAPISGTITNCTIADNEAVFNAGIATGGGVAPDVIVKNSIISNKADQSPFNCDQQYAAPATANLQWPPEPAGAALNGGRCAAGATTADPLLGSLRDNGGPTQTMPLLPGSPARGVGVDCPPEDQRGHPRPATGCALGAYEPE